MDGYSYSRSIAYMYMWWKPVTVHICKSIIQSGCNGKLTDSYIALI